MIRLTKSEARYFLLLKQGLGGEYIYIGKQGLIDFIHQAGCIQYDPIDICGKNAELVCQSRIKGFNKNMLYELLYSTRILFDYPDKNMSIMPIENWPYFERYRRAAQNSALKYPILESLIKKTILHIEKEGEVCSSDLKYNGCISWESSIHWNNSNNLSTAVLEHLYSIGVLIVHHKCGYRKYYDLASKYIKHEILYAKDPFVDEISHQRWRVLRRIRSIGLMWNRASDAWLNIWGFNSQIRNVIFKQLLEEGIIIEIVIDGIKDLLYCCAEDFYLINSAINKKDLNTRCEFIAPLDNLLWDRKLIQHIFNFNYKWEIYTPKTNRKYGYYVLPIIFNDKFIGRVELVVDKKTRTLNIKNIWFEPEVLQNRVLKSHIDETLIRFADFNSCKNIC